MKRIYLFFLLLCCPALFANQLTINVDATNVDIEHCPDNIIQLDKANNHTHQVKQLVSQPVCPFKGKRVIFGPYDVSTFTADYPNLAIYNLFNSARVLHQSCLIEGATNDIQVNVTLSNGFGPELNYQVSCT